ncbi:hypothetical protein Dimus_035677, partial [Dionaea muscipula]
LFIITIIDHSLPRFLSAIAGVHHRPDLSTRFTSLISCHRRPSLPACSPPLRLTVARPPRTAIITETEPRRRAITVFADHSPPATTLPITTTAARAETHHHHREPSPPGRVHAAPPPSSTRQKEGTPFADCRHTSRTTRVADPLRITELCMIYVLVGGV